MKNIFLKISIGALLFSSCQKNIDLKLDKEFTKPKLVLNSLLETDSIISVHLSSSASTFINASTNAITDAEINLYENGVFKEKLVHSNNGFYQTSLLLKPKPNTTYEVKITKSDFDNISASTTIPQLPLVSNIMLDTIEKSITFQLVDITGANYYQFNLSISDSTGLSNFPVGLQTKEKVLLPSDNQDNFNEAGRQQLPLTISDNLFDGKTATYKLYYEIFNGGEFEGNQIDYSKVKITFSASSISTELFNYLKSRQESLDNSGNPFSEPVLITSNVKNGYGIFGCKSSANFKLK